MRVLHFVSFLKRLPWLTNMCPNQGKLFENAPQCGKRMRKWDVALGGGLKLKSNQGTH